MNLPHFHHLFLAGSLLAGFLLLQQSHGQPAPESTDTQLVSELKSPSQWEISISNKNQIKRSASVRWDPAVPTKVSYTLSGTTVRIEQTWGDGTISEMWIVDGVTLIQYRNGIIEGRNAFDGDMWSRPGLVGTAWIIPGTQAKEISMQSRKVLVYEAKVLAPLPSGSDPTPMNEQTPGASNPAQPSEKEREDKWKAFIDAETKLPIKIQYNDYIIVYRYFPPPTTSVELPSKFQKALDDQMKRKQLIDHSPSVLPVPPNQ